MSSTELDIVVYSGKKCKSVETETRQEIQEKLKTATDDAEIDFYRSNLLGSAPAYRTMGEQYSNKGKLVKPESVPQTKRKQRTPTDKSSHKQKAQKPNLSSVGQIIKKFAPSTSIFHFLRKVGGQSLTLLMKDELNKNFLYDNNPVVFTQFLTICLYVQNSEKNCIERFEICLAYGMEVQTNDKKSPHYGCRYIRNTKNDQLEKLDYTSNDEPSRQCQQQKQRLDILIKDIQNKIDATPPITLDSATELPAAMALLADEVSDKFGIQPIVSCAEHLTIRGEDKKIAEVEVADFTIASHTPKVTVNPDFKNANEAEKTGEEKKHTRKLTNNVNIAQQILACEQKIFRTYFWQCDEDIYYVDVISNNFIHLEKAIFDKFYKEIVSIIEKIGQLFKYDFNSKIAQEMLHGHIQSLSKKPHYNTIKMQPIIAKMRDQQESIKAMRERGKTTLTPASTPSTPNPAPKRNVNPPSNGLEKLIHSIRKFSIKTFISDVTNLFSRQPSTKDFRKSFAKINEYENTVEEPVQSEFHQTHVPTFISNPFRPN